MVVVFVAVSYDRFACTQHIISEVRSWPFSLSDWKLTERRIFGRAQADLQMIEHFIGGWIDVVTLQTPKASNKMYE